MKFNQSVIAEEESVVREDAPNCQVIRPDAKVQALQDQLRPLDYDLET
jgi:hypothetical protein